MVPSRKNNRKEDTCRKEVIILKNGIQNQHKYMNVIITMHTNNNSTCHVMYI